MPANIIQGRYDELGEAASRFSAYSDSVKSLQGTILRQLDNLRNHGWIGKGADSFYAEMEGELLPGLNRLINALGDASSATNRIADTFRKAEDEACRLFVGDGAGGITGGGAGGIASGGAGSGGGAGSPSLVDRVVDFFTSDGMWKAEKSILKKILKNEFGDFLKEQIKRIPDLSDFGSKALNKVGGGLFGGVLDIGIKLLEGEPLSGEMVATQLLSGAAQGAVAMTGVGAIVQGADFIIQVGGNIGAEVGLAYADMMKDISPRTAPLLENSLKGLQGGLDNIKLDARFDEAAGTAVAGYQLFESYVPGSGMIGGVGGAAVGVVREAGQLVWGLGETTYYLGESAFNFGQTIGEAIVTQDVVGKIGDAASRAWNFLF